ncbi:hypothetical protein F4680DRAFT_450535 [Xylaria scruposa]|nr:hypothetical protein F4680DRAFT_450535 [Xylaria scruposa]
MDLFGPLSRRLTLRSTKPNRKPWVPVDLLLFEGYRRDWADFELLYLEDLQAMRVVKNDAWSWERIFAALIEAEDLAINTADGETLYYKRAAEILSSTWFHAKLGRYSVKCRLDDAPEGEGREYITRKRRGEQGGEGEDP